MKRNMNWYIFLKNWVSNQITGLERIRTWDPLVAKSGCILWAVDSSNDCGKDASFVTVPLSATLSDVWSDQEIKAWHDYSTACQESNQICFKYKVIGKNKKKSLAYFWDILLLCKSIGC